MNSSLAFALAAGVDSDPGASRNHSAVVAPVSPGCVGGTGVVEGEGTATSLPPAAPAAAVSWSICCRANSGRIRSPGVVRIGSPDDQCRRATRDKRSLPCYQRVSSFCKTIASVCGPSLEWKTRP